MLYRVLKVKKTASPAEIKAAYRKLALAMHPDKGGSPEGFLELQRAYETLSDEVTRSAYDSSLNQRREKLKGFKKPPPFTTPIVKQVAYVLANDEMYLFESSPSKVKCGLFYGDLISVDGARGCFVGLAADGWLYWCKEGNAYASQLCQAGSSFGLSAVTVVQRANFSARVHMTHTYGAKESPKVQGPVKRDAKGRSYADRLKQELQRKERVKMYERKIKELPEEERKERAQLESESLADFFDLHMNIEEFLSHASAGHKMAFTAPHWCRSAPVTRDTDNARKESSAQADTARASSPLPIAKQEQNRTASTHSEKSSNSSDDTQFAATTVRPDASPSPPGQCLHDSRSRSYRSTTGPEDVDSEPQPRTEEQLPADDKDFPHRNDDGEGARGTTYCCQKKGRSSTSTSLGSDVQKEAFMANVEKPQPNCTPHATPSSRSSATADNSAAASPSTTPRDASTESKGRLFHDAVTVDNEEPVSTRRGGGSHSADRTSASAGDAEMPHSTVSTEYLSRRHNVVGAPCSATQAASPLLPPAIVLEDGESNGEGDDLAQGFSTRRSHSSLDTDCSDPDTTGDDSDEYIAELPSEKKADELNRMKYQRQYGGPGSPILNASPHEHGVYSPHYSPKACVPRHQAYECGPPPDLGHGRRGRRMPSTSNGQDDLMGGTPTSSPRCSNCRDGDSDAEAVPNCNQNEFATEATRDAGGPQSSFYRDDASPGVKKPSSPETCHETADQSRETEERRSHMSGSRSAAREKSTSKEPRADSRPGPVKARPRYAQYTHAGKNRTVGMTNAELRQWESKSIDEMFAEEAAFMREFEQRNKRKKK